jgi:hypothetical protein
VRLKIIELPDDFGLRQFIVPKPERHLRKFAGLGGVTVKTMKIVHTKVITKDEYDIG